MGALRAGSSHHGDWWRSLITSAFLHASLLHIAFNMLALWWLGAPVERALGPGRYLGLYIVSGLAGAAGALVANPNAVTVGASGAIFGLLGAGLILEWQATGSLAGNYLTLIMINLGDQLRRPGISIGGHIGGLIGGILATLAFTRSRPGAPLLGGLSGVHAGVLIARRDRGRAFWSRTGRVRGARPRYPPATAASTPASLSAAWAAASRASGTRYGEQET